MAALCLSEKRPGRGTARAVVSVELYAGGGDVHRECPTPLGRCLMALKGFEIHDYHHDDIALPSDALSTTCPIPTSFTPLPASRAQWAWPQGRCCSRTRPCLAMVDHHQLTLHLLLAPLLIPLQRVRSPCAQRPPIGLPAWLLADGNDVPNDPLARTPRCGYTASGVAGLHSRQLRLCDGHHALQWKHLWPLPYK